MIIVIIIVLSFFMTTTTAFGGFRGFQRNFNHARNQDEILKDDIITLKDDIITLKQNMIEMKTSFETFEQRMMIEISELKHKVTL